VQKLLFRICGVVITMLLLQLLFHI